MNSYCITAHHSDSCPLSQSKFLSGDSQPKSQLLTWLKSPIRRDIISAVTMTGHFHYHIKGEFPVLFKLPNQSYRKHLTLRQSKVRIFTGKEETFTLPTFPQRCYLSGLFRSTNLPTKAKTTKNIPVGGRRNKDQDRKLSYFGYLGFFSEVNI